MRGRILLIAAAALAAACGDGSGPPRTLSDLSFDVRTNEWEPGVRHIIVIGEPGTISVATETTEGCIFNSPCPISVDVQVSSSNPAVVTLDHRTVHTPGDVRLIARGAGTTTISAKVANLSESARVDVVTAPLPLDDVRVILVRNWNDLPTQYDASQNLTWMSVPVGQTGALAIAALRGGAAVVGVPLSITSSAPAIAQATAGCRPPSMDPNCGVVSDGWVIGVAAGDADVTVTDRNITKHFTAHVVP